MKVITLYESIDKLAPFEKALPWDNVGILCGDPHGEVSRVLVTLDVTSEVIKRAKEEDADLIISHHPILLGGTKRVVKGEFPGNLIYEMLSGGIGLIAMHTNFDACVMGEICAERLGIEFMEALDEEGIGSFSSLEQEISLEDLSKKVKESFGLPYTNFYGNPNSLISKVAMVPGSGKSDMDTAIAKGAQVLITGDITHHVGLDALEKGISIIDAGHYGLEYIFMDYMKKWVESNFVDLDIITMEKSFPCTTI